MKLAKITGTVVATRKDESLVGYKLMIIRKINGHGEFIGEEEVAVGRRYRRDGSHRSGFIGPRRRKEAAGRN